MLTLAEIEALPFEPEAKDVGYVYRVSLFKKATYIGQRTCKNGDTPLTDKYYGSGDFVVAVNKASPVLRMSWKKEILATSRDQETLDLIEKFYIAQERSALGDLNDISKDDALNERYDNSAINLNIADGGISCRGSRSGIKRGPVQVQYAGVVALTQSHTYSNKGSASITGDCVVFKSREDAAKKFGVSTTAVSKDGHKSRTFLEDGLPLEFSRRIVDRVDNKDGTSTRALKKFALLQDVDSLAVLFHVSLASKDPELLSFVAPYLVDSDGREYRPGRLSPTTPLPLAA